MSSNQLQIPNLKICFDLINHSKELNDNHEIENEDTTNTGSVLLDKTEKDIKTVKEIFTEMLDNTGFCMILHICNAKILIQYQYPLNAL